MFISIPDVYLLYRLFMQVAVLTPAFIIGVLLLPIETWCGVEVTYYSLWSLWGDEIVERVDLLEYTEDVAKVSFELAESVKNEAEPVYRSPIDSVEKKYEKTPVHSMGAMVLTLTVGIPLIIIAVFITGR